MTTPAYRLTVTSDAAANENQACVLGRDIRSQPEAIARHCLAEHRAINEDVATIAEGIALADRLFPRHRGTCWARSIDLEIPVFELATFVRGDVLEALGDALHFLTGDLWRISFIKRAGRPPSQSELPFEKIEYRFVVPYSDGLDSFAQTALLASEVGERSILRLRSGRMGADSADLKRPVLRVPRGLGPLRKKEQTYRSRPFVFFSFAGIGAFAAGAESVVIGESGQGALGPALVPYGGEWPFRSTHPGFLSLMARYLSLVFSRHTPIDQPQLWRTKGEVLQLLKEKDLLGRWMDTRSCSVRPSSKHGARTCGICGGCLLRSLAVHAAGLCDERTTSGFSLLSVRAEASDKAEMVPSERGLAVRALGTIVEFAALSDTAQGMSAISRESMLFDKPDHKSNARNLANLAQRHCIEWKKFLLELPADGWARTLAAQL
jgi:7-cyano-7-deazaguanine synthase in queuosine biosynthesis